MYVFSSRLSWSSVQFFTIINLQNTGSDKIFFLMYVCICMYIHAHTRTHVHTNTHIHTRSLSLSLVCLSHTHTLARIYEWIRGIESDSRLWSSSQWQVMSIAPVIPFYQWACLCLTLKSSPWTWIFLKSNNTCQPVSVCLTSSVCLSPRVGLCACVCLSFFVYSCFSVCLSVSACLSVWLTGWLTACDVCVCVRVRLRVWSNAFPHSLSKKSGLDDDDCFYY